MNKDSIIQILKDSIQQLQNIEEVRPIYETILTEQHETYEFIMYIWLAISGVLIAGTLFWNFYISNKKIKFEVLESTSNIKKELNEKQEKFNSDINEKIKNLELSMTSQGEQNLIILKQKTDAINKNLHENQTKALDKMQDELLSDIEKFKADFNLRSVKNEANIARNFGVSAEEAGHYWAAITQYYFAAVHYRETKQSEMVSRCLNTIIDCLEKDETMSQFTQSYNEGNSLQKEFADSLIKNGISKFSNFLEDKKAKIQKKFDLLKKALEENE